MAGFFIFLCSISACSSVYKVKVVKPVDNMEEIVKRHENKLFRIAVAIIGSGAEAEDIVQEVFLKLFEKPQKFESQSHEIAWLIRVTVNLCKSRLRSHWWKRTVPLLKTHPASTEEQHDLMESILALPPKYRIAIHLFYYEGYSTREISELTNQREPTVRAQLTRARQKLKGIITEDLV